MNSTDGYQLTDFFESVFRDLIRNVTEPAEVLYDTYNVTSSYSAENDEDDVNESSGGVSDNISPPQVPHLDPWKVQSMPDRVWFDADDVMFSISGRASTKSSDVVANGDDEAVPLWIPYVAITIVMLALIAVSFARFHVVRGYQYRKRHQGAGDDYKDPSLSHPLAAAGSAMANGTAAAVCRSGVVSGLSATPEYLTMFLEFSRDENEEQRSAERNRRRNNGSRLHSIDLTGNGRPGGSARHPKRTVSADLQQTYSAATTATLLASSKRSNGASKAPETPTTRRPLAYTFNANGSMVDIRCSDDERTKTFRLLGANGGTTGNGCGGMPLGGTSVVAGTVLSGDDEEDSVVIVVAADDYVDDYDPTGSSGGDPTPTIHAGRRIATSTVVASRGERYYNDSGGGRSYRYARQVSSDTPVASSCGATPGVMTSNYSTGRPFSPSNDFRLPLEFRSKRI